MFTILPVFRTCPFPCPRPFFSAVKPDGTWSIYSNSPLLFLEKFYAGFHSHWKILPKGYKNFLNPLSANFTKWSNTLKQFLGKLPTNCLSVLDHFVGLALKGLTLILNN